MEFYIYAMDALNLNNKLHQPTISLKESCNVKVVRMANFLPVDERDTFFKAVCKEEGAFQTTQIPGVEKMPSSFLAVNPDQKNNKESVWLHEVTKNLSKRIVAQLPFLCKTLGISPFEVSDIPITFINGLDGHYGDPHADSVNGQYQISILYYFHKVPKVFNGGDLSFYASDEIAEDGYNKEVLFEIEAENNLLVAFRSETYHGVSKVQSQSIQFTDGRFVAVGFLGRQKK